MTPHLSGSRGPTDHRLAARRADLESSGIAFEVRQPGEAGPIAEKLLLGSTASSFLLEASCPVLAVKAE